uniref:Uncharacterized protein n=1 Tax=Megaselia scalaris TaxID=36166 RepID=T1GTK2_MEGSC
MAKFLALHMLTIQSKLPIFTKITNTASNQTTSYGEFQSSLPFLILFALQTESYMEASSCQRWEVYILL